jgi:hypothetical protein
VAPGGCRWLTNGLGGQGWPHGFSDGLWVCEWPCMGTGGLVWAQVAMGVIGGLWGLQLTSGVIGDTNYMSNIHKCFEL